MHNLLFAVFFAVAFATPSTVRAQNCLTPDTVAIPSFKSQLVTTVTATDTAMVNWRNSINLPSAKATAVSLITDQATCLKAANALAAITPGGDAAPAAYVFQIGTGNSTRYVAFNGRQKVHGSQYAYIFDKNFARLASFPY